MNRRTFLSLPTLVASAPELLTPDFVNFRYVLDPGPSVTDARVPARLQGTREYVFSSCEVLIDGKPIPRTKKPHV
jgi:hypothetical protein